MAESKGNAALEQRIARLEQTVDSQQQMIAALMQRRSEGGAPAAASVAAGLLTRLTTKQHAALQMLMAGRGNSDIASRFGVTENGAKVYVRAIAKKAGVNTRSQIVMAVYDEMQAIEAATYQIISRGLPKAWAAEWLEKDVKEDPYAKLYLKDDGEVDE
ncbi:MAG: LuxR C-terminal-related transcriptional regulator [Phenylobacterium sp.]|uniref:LuxR C-terminal-related transcriptional regulator n=1 Tax=Phenylobacterium sp. TaxID=1871053 RepID=UPI00272450A7|nr:LuxR C-terminal-related transcriptional regulator [Phenylobacterium sp.]MDO8912276.1 LuxR C-terminal-related transcriptional regulator [Phenylobacterium sp.]MDP3099488.1 LuxR C-terminal-related transcriptional regulator [Phenylobacterium sp.]